jgi:hypothetical protein
MSRFVIHRRRSSLGAVRPAADLQDAAGAESGQASAPVFWDKIVGCICPLV